MRIIKWGLVGLAVFLVSSAALNVWMIQRTQSRLDEQLDAIRADGHPVLLTDYEHQKVAPEDNAITYIWKADQDLNAAWAKIEALYIDSEIRPLEGAPLTPEECAAIKAILAGYPQLLPRLEQAAACPHHEAALNYSQGIATTLNHLQAYRKAMQTLAIRGRMHAAEGRANESVRDAQRVMNLSSLLQSEPTLISYLVSVAGNSIAVENVLNEALRAGPVDDALRDELEKQLAGLDSLEPLKQSMVSERAMGVQTFQQLRDGSLNLGGITGGGGGGAQNWFTQSWLGRAYLNDDQSTYLELFDETIELADKSRDEYEAQVAEQEEQLQSLGVRGAVTRLMFPALNSVRKSADQNLARVRLARVLNALTRAKQQDPSALPKLSDLRLPADATIDPFNDKPLVIRRDEDGWVIYSVGDDLKDDGGQAKDGDSFRPPDIVLEPPVHKSPRKLVDDSETELE